MQKLRISDELSLPIDAVTGTFCVVGIRGSGKSTTAVDIAEEMLKAKQQIVVLDPKDDWWGIRASADGKSEGLPVTILGGTHQDAPLEHTAGALVAELILNEKISAIIATKHLSDGQRFRFTYDFCDFLYKHCSEPIHLFIDEADQFAPQEKQFKIQKDDKVSGQKVSESMMLSLVRRVIKQGRTSGLGTSLITQSPATLDKRVMNMCETLIAMRVIGAQDFEAVKKWFAVYLRKSDDLESIVSQLPTLRAGQGVFYSPAWLEVSKVVQFRMAETFDSRKTPKVGERRVEPKILAPVDLERLSARMAATIEKAKQDDPKELKKQIAELKRAQQKHEPDPQAVERAVNKAVSEAENRFELLQRENVRAINDLRGRLDQIAKLATLNGNAPALAEYKPVKPRVVVDRPAPPQPPQRRVTNDSATGLQQAEKSFLSVLAQRSGKPTTRNQLAVLAGYSAKSRHVDNVLSALRTKGYVDGRGEIFITESGINALGEFSPLPSGRDLLNYWLSKLDAAPSAMLRTLADVYPNTLTRDEIAERAGYSVTSRHVDNCLSTLRTRELIEGRGELRASEELFD